MLNKKIKKLLIGTNNKGKLEEIRNLLPKKLKIYSTSDFKIKSPKENGRSFKENSLIKSKYFSKKTNLVCIADDSGLEIKARFICALSISYLDKQLGFSIGKVEGKISLTPKGNNGFGYDPIFIPKNENLTFGQMKPTKKYKIDHRFNAFQKIKKFL